MSRESQGRGRGMVNKMCREVWRPDGVEGWEAIGVYTVESEVWMNGTVGDRGLYGGMR